MNKTISRVSDAAVKRATGKTWEEWFEFLDAKGAKRLPHREIVALLKDKGRVENPWWQQKAAVRYEQARGLRTIGQTAAAGFEIGVAKTLPVTPREAWDLVTQPPGLTIWLGNISGLPLSRGGTYVTGEGTRGEIRSVDPGRRLRLTWQPPRWEKPTTLQLTVEQSGGNTVVHIHQEKLSSERTREWMRSRWQHVLEQLRGVIEKPEDEGGRG